MNREQIFVIWVIVCFLVGGQLGLGMAQNEEQTRLTLKGLGGVHVYVEELAAEIEKEGLRQSDLRADAEQQLEAAGIRILGNMEKALGNPYLYIYVHVFRLPTQTRRYLYYVRVELNQDVLLVREPKIVGSAVTWSDGGVGIDFSLEHVREVVGAQVSKFVKAYGAMNPTTPSTK